MCTRAENASANKWLLVLFPFTMFHWHNETFDIPNGCDRLFSSQFCENQAYAYGDKVLAMECHVEMTEPLVTDWITHWKHDLLEESPSRGVLKQFTLKLDSLFNLIGGRCALQALD